MYAKIRKNKNFFIMVTAGLLMFFTFLMTSTAFSQMADDQVTTDTNDVIHNPGFVSGNISLGDMSKNTVKPVSPLSIFADGTDESGNPLYAKVSFTQILGTYNNLDVHIPDINKMQTYDIGCIVNYSADKFEYFAFKLQSVAVSYETVTTVDFELKPGFISGKIQPENCDLQGGWIMADSTYDNYAESDRRRYSNEETRIRFGADGEFHFPVTPNQNIRVWGQYQLKNGWSFELKPKYISVGEGDEVYPGWEIEPCPTGECADGSKLSGIINLQGLEYKGGYKIWLSGATKKYMYSADGNYMFDNLNKGLHYLTAVVNDTDDYIIIPGADYNDWNQWYAYWNKLTYIDIPECSAVIKDVTPSAAFLNGKIIFPKGRTVVQFEDEQDPADPKLNVISAVIESYGLNGAGGWSVHRNGYSKDIIDIKSGEYDLILSQGTWRVHNTGFQFTNDRKSLCYNPDNDNISQNLGTNIGLSITEYKKNGKETIVSLGAGEVRDDHNFEFETGSVTVRFYISGGGTFDTPHLSATCRIENSDKFIVSGASSDGIMTNAEKTEGEATVIGTPGNYTIKASAIVNGISTSFGQINVNIEAGVCKKICVSCAGLKIDEVQNICGNETTVSGKAWDNGGITSILINGKSVMNTPTGNTDPAFPNEVSFSTVISLEEGANTVKTEVTNIYDKTASDIRTFYAYKAGVFTVTNEDGEVKIDWLYDGGAYRGEFGIFSLAGMENFIPNSTEFIREAARRALSNSTDGHLVFSDITEGARFSGQLGSSKEPDRNSGPYKGIKTCPMKPGDSFATIFVPNSTLQALYNNPATTDRNIVPIFSLASSNPDHKMYLGQFAKIVGKEDDQLVEIADAFAFEDIIFENSDRDYNDIIVQFQGISVCAPTLDNPGLSFRNDWRAADDKVIPHLEVSPPNPDTLWMTITLKSPADLIVYDPSGRFIGKEGGYIPGATFEFDENGHQIVTLPALENGDYRVVLQGIREGGLCHLEMKGFEGDAELALTEIPFEIAPHQTLVTYVSAKEFLETQTVAFEVPHVSVSSDGKILMYDFDGDGDIDIVDIMKVSSKWDTSIGDEAYDEFYDFDDSKTIRLSDIMRVVNISNVR